MPDYLDTEDILVRRGSVVERSQTGRWISRLSFLVTDLLAARLTKRIPGALVTDQRGAASPDYRVMVEINRLDITSAGMAFLEADWQVIPRNPRRPTVSNRVQIRISGPAATDRDAVSLETTLVDLLANAIQLPNISVAASRPERRARPLAPR